MLGVLGTGRRLGRQAVLHAYPTINTAKGPPRLHALKLINCTLSACFHQVILPGKHVGRSDINYRLSSPPPDYFPSREQILNISYVS
jgi:hypothetical protein